MQSLFRIIRNGYQVYSWGEAEVSSSTTQTGETFFATTSPFLMCCRKKKYSKTIIPLSLTTKAEISNLPSFSDYLFHPQKPKYTGNLARETITIIGGRLH